jgi:ABC-type transporter Mla maintaining outer membrane lipid asymmetry permease subunit MlaE
LSIEHGSDSVEETSGSSDSNDTVILPTTLVWGVIGAVLGVVIGPYIAAEFTTVYVFQAGEYRILGALVGGLGFAAIGAWSAAEELKKKQSKNSENGDDS